MKTVLTFAVLAFVSARLLGAIPDNVSGLIYRESSRGGRDAYFRAYALGNDGRYTGLYTYSNIGGTIYPAATLNEAGGYSYRPLDATSAVMKFSSDSNTATITRTLLFTSDAGGSATATGTTADLGGTFELVPLRRSAPMLNSSNRSHVLAGGTAHSGFVLNSFSIVLVRAVGPGLSAFGVQGALRDPKLAVVGAGTSRLIETIDGIAPSAAVAVRRVGAIVGAFPFTENSKDAAIILPLRAGA